MNIQNRLKRLENGMHNTTICGCCASLRFERTDLNNPGELAPAPDYCHLCGKPVGEKIVKVILPAKLSIEEWKISQSRWQENK